MIKDFFSLVSDTFQVKESVDPLLPEIILFRDCENGKWYTVKVNTMSDWIKNVEYVDGVRTDRLYYIEAEDYKILKIYKSSEKLNKTRITKYLYSKRENIKRLY